MSSTSQIQFICIFDIFHFMVIIIDSHIAGISGDMLLSSLVDIGADKNKIIQGIKTAANFFPDSKIIKLDFEKTKKNGLEATKLVLDIQEDAPERKGIEIQKCIEESVDNLNLSKNAKKFSIASIETLIAAESHIHGAPRDSVHFHEAASIDTIIDIIGSAIALDDLKFFDQEIISTPVAVGGGTVSFSHGTTTNPASAILEIFKNTSIIIKGGQAVEELTTPTGASMLVNLVSSCREFYPSLQVEGIGYGAGCKDFENFSNVLKIVKGKKTPEYTHDYVQILETNLDDVSGEILGNTIEKIMNNGAKDVTVTSAITKKGRPTHLVSVICDSSKTNDLLELLFSETGTLGIRIRTSDRVTLTRTIKSASVLVENKNFTVNYKTSPNQPSNFKIESDDIQKISNEIKKSFRHTEDLLRTEIKKILEQK